MALKATNSSGSGMSLVHRLFVNGTLPISWSLNNVVGSIGLMFTLMPMGATSLLKITASALPTVSPLATLNVMVKPCGTDDALSSLLARAGSYDGTGMLGS